MRKVFGIGLNKTGTTTLGACLVTLGYRHVGHRADMLTAYLKGDIGSIVAETACFDSFSDWPWPLVYEELFRTYGSDAQYVLTVRSSPEVWVESLKAHSLNTHPVFPMRAPIYGYKYPHGYELEHTAFYERHNSRVRTFFSQCDRNTFLEVCWEKGDSWGTLCEFLGCPAPQVPLPHVRPRSGTADSGVRALNAANIAEQVRNLKREEARAEPRSIAAGWAKAARLHDKSETE